MRFLTISWMLVFIVGFGLIRAQNLVPNHNFDLTKDCPFDRGLIEFAEPWFSANGRTTDLAHECANLNGNTGMPTNRWGNQVAVEGRGYAGIRTWFASGGITGSRPYREYVAAPLDQALEAGETYFLQFFANPGESAKWVTDDIGLALVDSIPGPMDVYFFQPALANQPQRYLDNFDFWYEISGTYVANGTEKVVIIGNFLDDPQTSVREGNQLSTDSLFESTYLFVDAVSVVPCRALFPDSLLVSDKTSLCPGESLPIRLHPEVLYDEIRWSNGSTQPQITASLAGWYEIEVEYKGCMAKDSIEIETFDEPIVDLGADVSICPGEEVRLESLEPPAGNYLWSNGETSESILISEAGTYRLEVEADGCTGSDEIDVSYLSPPNSAIGFDSTLCE
ncbi:MAG: hypothetical protein AAF206_29060, partial [Bacteroidota bacterium]